MRLGEQGAWLANFQVRPVLVDMVIKAQELDQESVDIKISVEKGEKKHFIIQNDGALMWENRLYVPHDNEAVKRAILDEAHLSAYAMHSGSTKLYRNRDPRFTSKFWKAFNTAMGTQLLFSTAYHPQTDGHYHSSIGVAPYEALYGRVCRTPLCWAERGKLSLRYVGPYQITERIGAVAYRLELPPELSLIHNVFHVSMLRKYVSDSSHIIQLEPLEVSQDVSYVEKPVAILDRQDKVLRNKVISLVNVLWRNHVVEEAVWETEDLMRSQYPYLFA
ncbi:unnamed protein product [Malus baccata var. baccata]